MVDERKLFVNIHGHRNANNIQEWVLRSLMASAYPPDDIEYGYYSVGFHPYNVGKFDEQDTLNKVRLSTENPNVFAIGEIGLDKSIDVPMEVQQRIFERQVEIAEFADLPVILHVVKAFNEVIEFSRAHKPAVPMIIHGYNGSKEMAADLVKEGFLISFGEALAQENSKLIEACREVPLDKMFLETDDGEMDIREVYHTAAEIKGVSMDQLRLQIVENVKTHMPKFAGIF